MAQLLFSTSVSQLFLTVYVDDFKMAGPSANLARGWKMIRQHITTGDPTPLGLYLGCEHRLSDVPLPGCTRVARCIQYDMSDFLQSCVDVYVGLAGPAFKLKVVPTPLWKSSRRRGHLLPTARRPRGPSALGVGPGCRQRPSHTGSVRKVGA